MQISLLYIGDTGKMSHKLCPGSPHRKKMLLKDKISREISSHLSSE
jgi:hypothetical protein